MPNQANRSNDKSGIVQPKRKTTKAAGPNSNQKPSDRKGGDLSKGAQGGSGKSSTQENKRASGSNPKD